MARTLIIGYGNPLRSDDGVGLRTAELLAEVLEQESDRLNGDVEVIACHQLTLELTPLVAAADRLILLDAHVGGEPGAVIERELTPAIADTAASLSHHLDPSGLLAAAQILYGQAPTTILLTVAGASFDYGEALSPPVAAALPLLVARVQQLLIR